ncbi:MAG: hypothetical protein QW767_05315 [Thermoprotei archaeon]
MNVLERWLIVFSSLVIVGLVASASYQLFPVSAGQPGPGLYPPEKGITFYSGPPLLFVERAFTVYLPGGRSVTVDSGGFASVYHGIWRNCLGAEFKGQMTAGPCAKLRVEYFADNSSITVTLYALPAGLLAGSGYYNVSFGKPTEVAESCTQSYSSVVLYTNSTDIELSLPTSNVCTTVYLSQVLYQRIDG